ncbi:CDP-archaeol synthase [Candidatus Woesearchaeota archaeon]|nr:CDP-archaeol synthase [Candidatus Woesearchaeota archaeon]
MIPLLIAKALYFFLPAYFANMAPVLVKKIPFLNKPVWEKKLGSHKTWRGLFFGSVAGVLTFWLQKLAYINGFQNLALIDYTGFSILFGFLLGFGALLGDAVKSYYKRKADLSPGKPWIPFDQLDFVFGAIILGFLMYVPPVEIVLILLIVSPLLHLLTNYMGFLMKINQNKI